MLTFDFFQCVAKRLQEVLVGLQHRAVHVELNHSLSLVDRGQLSSAVTESRDIAPLKGEPSWLAGRILHRSDLKLNLGIADSNVRLQRKIARVRQQLTLMRRNLVEPVDACADDICRIEIRPELSKALRMMGEQIHRGLVHVLNDEIDIHNHDRTGNPVQQILLCGFAFDVLSVQLHQFAQHRVQCHFAAVQIARRVVSQHFRVVLIGGRFHRPNHLGDGTIKRP